MKLNQEQKTFQPFTITFDSGDEAHKLLKFIYYRRARSESSNEGYLEAGILCSLLGQGLK